MYRCTLSPRHAGRRLAGVILAAAAGVGCTEPLSPARPVSPTAIIIIGGRPAVFNAQLRAIGNPDERPPSAVVGHLQVKLYESGDGGRLLAWQAHLSNPECDASSSFGGGIYAIQDSEDFPSPEDEARVAFVPDGPALGCGDTVRDGVAPISAGLAALLIADPGSFLAVFFLDGGGAVAGTLELGR